MKRLSLLTAAFGLAVGLGLTAAPADAQEVTLRLHTFLPPVANPVKTFLIPWAEKVGKESDGRIKVEVYPAMQLGGKPPQLLDQVRDGVADIVWTLPGFTAGRMPKVETFELPFINRNALSTTLALQEFQDKWLEDELADYHVIIMHAHAGSLFMTREPIEKLEDLKGMKLRAASRTGVWVLEALGASAVGVDLTELAPMLSKGTINGSLLPYEIAPAVKMHELVDYFTILAEPQTRIGPTVFAFLMNKDSYDRLPDDLKKVIDDNSGDNIAEWVGQNWDEIEEPGLQVMQSDPNNKFNQISPEETQRIRDAVQPVFTRFYEEMDKLGVDGEAMVEDARTLVDKYSQGS
jgi:TRAP-type C4-dicarboxylate transport system substrate-binding protein